MHQEQMNEITDFLTAKQQELRLSDSDLLEISAGRIISSRGPNAPLLNVKQWYVAVSHCSM